MNRTSYRKVNIEPAGEEHLADIQQLAHRIWFEHYPGIITEAQIIYMLERDYAVQSLTHDLADGVSIDRLLVDDELRGFAAYGPYGDAQDFKLHKLYVLKSFHGLGLGSMLLRHLEAACRDKGAGRVILSVNKNNHKAIRAYERNGYAILDSVVVDIGSGFVMDDYIMAKPLKTGSA